MPKPTDPQKWKYQFSDDMTFSQKVVLFHPTLETRFLTLKRSSQSNNPGLWDLPGGNVLYGELHQESITREIFEETGIQNFTPLVPTIVTSRLIKEPELYRLFIGYKAKSLETQITLSEEHTEYKWVTLNQFKELDAKTALQNVVKAAF